MFQIPGDVYDAVYAGFKDPATEAREVLRLVDERGVPAQTLLDMACGTGAHLEHFAARFEVAGVDLDTRLLSRAWERLPGSGLFVADMCSVDLGRRFDVVTCLFSSIGYAKTRSVLNAIIANFARHMEPDGIVIVEGSLTPDDWDPGRVGHVVVEEPGRTIVRADRSETRGRTATLFMDYLVATQASIEHFSETHETGLFTRAEYVAAFEKAQLDCEILEHGLSGRGIYIGRRRSN